MLLLFVVTPTNGPSLGARMSFLLLLGISQLAVVNSLGSVTLRTALAVGIFAYSAVIDIVVYRSSSVPGELFLVGVEQPCSTEKKKIENCNSRPTGVYYKKKSFYITYLWGQACSVR